MWLADPEEDEVEALRKLQAERSESAKRKAATKRTAKGETCHTYRSLLRELSLLTRNTIRVPTSDATFAKLAEPTPLQQRALELVGARSQ